MKRLMEHREPSPCARMRDIAQIKIVTRMEMSKTPSEYGKSYL